MVVTDHSSLRWLHNLQKKNPIGKLARWALELLEYDYEVIHRKAALHHVPDALSRMFERNTNEDALEMGIVNLVTAKDAVDEYGGWMVLEKLQEGDIKAGEVHAVENTWWTTLFFETKAILLVILLSKIVEDLDF